MKKSDYILPAVSALVVICFSINKSSIWIDEMITYGVVHGKSFTDMFSSIWNAHSANGGMPLYFVFEWMSCRLFGYDEIGLRLLNLPFAIVYLVVSWCMIRKMQAPAFFCLLFFFHPLFLYYMNEARPYIQLLCFGSVFTYLLFCCDVNNYKQLIFLHLSFLLGLLTHMMFVFIMLMYVVQCMYLISSKKLELKKHLLVLGAFCVPYAAILWHYMGVMTGAEEIGGVNMLAPDWKAGVAQIIYYFAGFGGLGLSRNDLRAMLFSQLSWVHMSCIALLVCGYFTLGAYVVKNGLWKNKRLSLVFLSGAFSFGCFCVANIIFRTRFWERHVIYLLPVLLLVFCLVLLPMVRSKKNVYRSGAILIVGLIAVSGLRTMFDTYYRKEDYKGVSTYIKDKKDSIFLLQGDSSIYGYYGVAFDHPRIRMINNLSSEELKSTSPQTMAPLFLVLSSRLEFDSKGLYRLPYPLESACYNSFRIVPYLP